MALELNQHQVDTLQKIITNYQGNHTTHNRRKAMIEPWQIIKAKEMLDHNKTFKQIIDRCNISIYKIRKIRRGVYDHVLNLNTRTA